MTNTRSLEIEAHYQDQLDAEGRYAYERTIGRGNYGTVVAARDTKSLNGELVAIKVINRTAIRNEKKLKYEIENLQQIKHPHVMKLKEVVGTSEHLGIVMEYVPHGTLYQYLAKTRCLPDRLVRFFFQQIVVAVDYFHSEQIFDQVFRMENCLVDGDTAEWPILKLSDFGLSKLLKSVSAGDAHVGIPQLLPPEIIDFKPGDKYDGYKVDVWCIGLLLYKMTTGKYPFSEEHNEGAIHFGHVLHRIRRLDYRIPELVPDDCADIIQKILVKNPKERPTIKEIQEHSYFKTDLPKGAEKLNEKLLEFSYKVE